MQKAHTALRYSGEGRLSRTISVLHRKVEMEGLVLQSGLLESVRVFQQEACTTCDDESSPENPCADCAGLAGFRSLMLSEPDWRELGEPETITVTIDPGDTLNV